MIRYIDIGLNLFSDQFKGREEEIMNESLKCETGFIITGSSERSSKEAADFAQSHSGIYSTAGIHPHGARNATESTYKVLEELLARPSTVAVGECGLDYDRMFSPADVQRDVFRRHLEIAKKTGKPLFLHERSAADDFYQILSEYPEQAKRAVVHCYTGDRKTAERYLSLGSMIGITGWICDDRRNAELLGAIKVIPFDRLMAETDAPYLIPRGIKGLKNPNLPQNIKYVVQKIAKEKCANEEQVRQILLDNTKRFFSI